MLLTPGTRLGPYEILAPIGAGGMGEVYKAKDTRLDRLVAVKVAQEHFSERFEHEARAVAALNHSNTCTLHDIGPDYLVMESLTAHRSKDRWRPMWHYGTRRKSATPSMPLIAKGSSIGI